MRQLQKTNNLPSTKTPNKPTMVHKMPIQQNNHTGDETMKEYIKVPLFKDHNTDMHNWIGEILLDTQKVNIKKMVKMYGERLIGIEPAYIEKENGEITLVSFGLVINVPPIKKKMKK